MNTVIILTATITPNSWAGQLTEPSKRRLLYIEALEWYLENTQYNIVFAENSGECIKSHRNEFATNRIEFLTFNDPPDIPDRGKGYKELKIIEYVYNNSGFILDSDLVVKITGKLICYNICQIIRRLQDRKVTDIISCSVNIKNNYTDSRFFVSSRSFLKLLLKYKSEMDYSFGFEDALLRSVNEYKKNDKGNFIYLPLAPRIGGVSGRNETRYKSDIYSFKLLSLKHFLKKLNYNLRYS